MVLRSVVYAQEQYMIRNMGDSKRPRSFIQHYNREHVLFFLGAADLLTTARMASSKIA